MPVHMLARYIVPLAAVLSAYWLFRRSKKSKRCIEDEVVVVIGASSGVGLAVAKLYASSAEAANRRTIHIVARSRELLKIASEIISEPGSQAVHAHIADACSEDDLAELVTSIRQSSGRIDTLVFW